jgi:hypothetical protein
MKPKPYLGLYEKLSREGLEDGLCVAIRDEISHYDKEIFRAVFKPTLEEALEYHINDMYWGSESMNQENGIFTPTRQTMLLLMAAMEGELV